MSHGQPPSASAAWRTQCPTSSPRRWCGSAVEQDDRASLDDDAHAEISGWPDQFRSPRRQRPLPHPGQRVVSSSGRPPSGRSGSVLSSARPLPSVPGGLAARVRPGPGLVPAFLASFCVLASLSPPNGQGRERQEQATDIKSGDTAAEGDGPPTPGPPQGRARPAGERRLRARDGGVDEAASSS